MGMRCCRRCLFHRFSAGNGPDEVTKTSERPGAKISPRDLNRVLFTLEASKFEQFAVLLDAPPVPNADLARLLAVRAPWASDSE